MKIIVFSDSHGNIENMKKVIDKTLPMTDLQLYIHCGDGLMEFNMLRERYPEKRFIGVQGNNDNSDEPYDAVIDFDGYRTLITHSHRYYGDLLNIAKARDIQIVLYGHTHIRSYSYSDGVHLFNPGSIARPRDGKLSSYGVVEIRRGVLFSHGEVRKLY